MSEILVVKLGGTTIADQQHVLAEVAAVARRRPVVLVHGGGKRITEWLDRLGVPSTFEGGLRVTDAAALEVAAAVLRGVVNSELVAGLRDLGVDAVGLSGVDGGLLIAERVPGMGLVAHVVGLRRDLLDAILVGGQVPVVAPLARDEDGIVCNVNADDAAAGIAAGLGARQLVLMTDVDGVRDANGSASIRSRRTRPGPDRERRHRRRHGAQGPGRPCRACLGGQRGRDRRLGRAGSPRAVARRSDVRHAGHRRSSGGGGCGMTVNAATKRDRQQAIRELIARQPVASQTEFVEAAGRSRDPGDAGDGQPRHRRDEPRPRRAQRAPRLGLAGRSRAAPATRGGDERLRRILADIPVTVGRSGLILVLTGTPGTASVIAQAIDESTLQEQEGTLAGDNTLLVLFADERRLERWRERFQAIQAHIRSPAGIPSPSR